MKIYVIGKTQADLFPYMGDSRRVMPGKADGSAFEARHKGMVKGFPDTASEGEALIEFAGRLCYESFDMPNPKTATRAGYIANILMQNHESVLEHVSVTFYVEGVSRNLSHELIRHRHLSFSELSQRYVNMEEANYIVPPAWRQGIGGDSIPLSDCSIDHAQRYRENVEGDLDAGLTRKQAREAARYSLPAGTETKFVVTGNLRAWRDVLKKRDSKFADAEMQLFAKEVKRQLGELYPNALGDLHEGGSS